MPACGRPPEWPGSQGSRVLGWCLSRGAAPFPAGLAGLPQAEPWHGLLGRRSSSQMSDRCRFLVSCHQDVLLSCCLHLLLSGAAGLRLRGSCGWLTGVPPLLTPLSHTSCSPLLGMGPAGRGKKAACPSRQLFLLVEYELFCDSGNL